MPITSGSTASEALQRSIDLARHAESFGYQRYWVAEHHLNPGVAGTSPPVVVGLLAGATKAIRVGSGGVQMGHRTPLAVVEEFGLLDAVYPDRLDLGLGRSGGRNFTRRTSGDSAEKDGTGKDGEDRCRRAGHHHHHPRTRRPGPVVSAPG